MKQYLWVETDRPETVQDCILPESLKKRFQQYVDDKNIPNLLMVGHSGIGKTSVAVSMCKELGCDYIIINGSMKGNIDTLRTDIQNFASSISFTGGRKYVILDEADYLNPNSTQPALRNFMEEFSKNCGFILTCNYKNRIIKELHSRCSVIDFAIENEEKPRIAAQFFKKATSILKRENVAFDPRVVAEVINKYFPDFRRVLNELQAYSGTGQIDTGILKNLSDENVTVVIELIKKKDFYGIRKWVHENIANDQVTILRAIYDHVEKAKPQYVPMLVILIGKYQYQAAFAVDPEVNLMAFFAEVLVEGIFE